MHGCRSELETLLTELGYDLVRDDQGRPVDAAPPRRPARGLRRRPRRPRPGHPRRAAAGDGHGRRRPRALRARQPREQAGPRARRPQGAGQPRPRGDAGPARRRRAEEFRRRGRGRSATAWSPTSCSTTAGSSSRTPASRRPTTAARPAGCAASRCTATRPARPTSSGCPCATRGRNDYRGRAMVLYGHTPDARAGVGQQHAVPRHRLRVRRPADRAALPREGDRLGAGRAGLVRAGQAVPARRPRPRGRPRARPARRRRRARQARRRDRAPRPGHRARGERRRRARGDEPVRAGPALAAVPAADDGAGRRPRRAPDLLEHPDEAFAAYAARRRHDARLRGEAHGLAGRRAGLPRRRGRGERFGATDGETGAVYTRTGRSFFDRATLTEQLLAGVRAAVDRRRPVGRARHRLAAARRRAAAVVGQGRATCCATSTPRSAPPPAPRCRPRSPACEAAPRPGIDVGDLLARTRARAANAEAFTAAYRRYCWPTDGLDGVRLAPFQVLATRGRDVPRPRPRLAPRRSPTGSSRPAPDAGPDRRGGCVVDTDRPRVRRRPASPGGRS